MRSALGCGVPEPPTPRYLSLPRGIAEVPDSAPRLASTVQAVDQHGALFDNVGL